MQLQNENVRIVSAQGELCGSKEVPLSSPDRPLVEKNFGPVKLLILQGTPFCNINCRYCYLPDRDNTGRMTVETVEAVIDRLHESGFLCGPLLVNWHAGEPLVLPVKFYEERMHLFDKLTNAGIPVTHSLQTNGMLITDAYCNLFKTYDVKVGVSIDGPAFIHDAQRQLRNGQGSHAPVLHGLRKLQEHNISFNAICVLSDLSVRYPDEIYQFFKDTGVRAVGFNLEEVEGANPHSSISAEGFDERYIAFLGRLWELVQQDKGLIRVREFDDAEGRILDPFPRRNSQVEPFVNLSITFSGDYSTFCPELLGNQSPKHAHFIFGNVHRDRFCDVINNDNFRTVYGEIQRGVEICSSTCDYFKVCGGGNPSNKISENETFESAETQNCRNRIKATCEFVIDKIERRIV